MPNTYIDAYKYSKFDSFEFPVTEKNREKKQQIEGAWYFFRYNDPWRGK